MTFLKYARILVRSPNLSGGVHVILSIAKALKNLNYDVKIMSREKPNWYMLSKIFGNITTPIPWTPLVLSEQLGLRPQLPIAMTKIIALWNRYLLINVEGDALPLPAHITYIHFPLFALGENKLHHLALYYGENLQLKSKIISMLRTRLLYNPALNLSYKILVNSKFTANILGSINKKAKVNVLYPPLRSPFKDYIKNNLNNSNLLKNRKKYVITISGFHTKKKLTDVLLIAKEIKHAKFIIIGALWDLNYYKKLRNTIQTLSLKNVILLPNLEKKKLCKLLLKSKIYLHTARFEHFGISIVEAMASGLVPVVHKSGGPWEDILDKKQGLYGYAYSNIYETVSYIENLLTDENLRFRLAKMAIKRSLMFSEEKFSERFQAIVKSLERQLPKSLG